MLRPTPKEKQLAESLRESQRQGQRVEELKEKVRILIESPLFFNADMINHGLVADNGRILQVIQK
jgi:hypothetical protein